MLENLSVKNVALIDNLFVEFEEGFNVLTGETGAGKSILIGSLSLLLGGKSSPEMIRTGCSEATVSGSFFIDDINKKAHSWLRERGIEADENRVLLRRNLKQNGRSSAWIQSVPVTKGELEEFSSFLIDIHGQHQHQSLFKVGLHRQFLDSFGDLNNEVKLFTNLYLELADKLKQLENMNLSEKEIAEKTELLNFAIEEISKAKLKDGEKEELEAEENRLNQYEKLYELVNNSINYLSDERGVLVMAKKVAQNISSATTHDDSLSSFSQRIDGAYYELEDVFSSLESYLSELTFDPQRLDQIGERLSLIYKLTKKYGSTIKEVLEYATNAETELESLSKTEAGKEEIQQEIKNLQAKILKLGCFISEKRKTASATMQKEVEEILSHLGMVKTKFQVRVDTRLPEGNKRIASPYGFDDIEFMISANLGEPLRPLAKIASGGELSRVMLALKTVLSEGDEVSSLIFDEIDTGIGGEVALSIASHIKNLSKKKQIICITHLAVIASHADNHIKIEKNTIGQTTTTSARTISSSSRVEEIARMLAGDEFSEASLIHSKELLTKYSLS